MGERIIVNGELLPASILQLKADWDEHRHRDDVEWAYFPDESPIQGEIVRNVPLTMAVFDYWVGKMWAISADHPLCGEGRA